MTTPFRIFSEINELEKVIVHRPGKEIENLSPEYMEELLFDDIPNLRIAQREHDEFVKALSSKGAEVVYLTDMATEALKEEHVRKKFITEYLHSSLKHLRYDSGIYYSLEEFLVSKPPAELVETVISGVRRNEVNVKSEYLMAEMINHDFPFYLDPLPNMYFTRDPAAIIGESISLNLMDQKARKNETLFLKYIVKHSHDYVNKDIPIIYDKDDGFPIEAGDILILSPDVIAIGISARTSPHAIEKLFRNLRTLKTGFKKVIAIQIPKKRAFMHLDTVFTQVDIDKFTIHPTVMKIAAEMDIYILQENKDGEIEVEKRNDLTKTLKECLALEELTLIPVGDGQAIEAAREQWNDGSNTFALAPGTIITYDRNYVTNDTLRAHGINVIEVPSSELARGRGGPRCMTMPLKRK
ncbi:arginine deiminase [Salipaludibacillus agaradhaerens]|uniref:Arginine deiminase n=1 Tax=Salipaludibacillus agaradhaerens TaxID=76935 RepID=A0A9Q4B1P2_SALAG|nr:arginine deiminase [Salipaludibacillus agaradhaerens]MCR6096400.1 arginine deiminase [Salipaludibacillus agaradhaerens]MCR6114041.1 arginine deiminase [Salipaludibacillus agaradhaerens]